MGWFRKKSDPITDRARALNEQIARLEAQIEELSTGENTNPNYDFDSHPSPPPPSVTNQPGQTIDPPSLPTPSFTPKPSLPPEPAPLPPPNVRREIPAPSPSPLSSEPEPKTKPKTKPKTQNKTKPKTKPNLPPKTSTRTLPSPESHPPKPATPVPAASAAAEERIVESTRRNPFKGPAAETHPQHTEPSRELGVRKYNLTNFWRRFKNNFRGPATSNPKLVNYLAAGSIQGLRPLRYEKRVARNRFLLLLLCLVFVLWGIIAIVTNRY